VLPEDIVNWIAFS